MKKSIQYLLWVILPAAFILPFSTSCVTTSQGERMQRDIIELQAHFDALRDEKEDLVYTLQAAQEHGRRLEELIDETTQVLRRNNADFGLELEDLRQEVHHLRGMSEKVAHDLERLSVETRGFQELVGVRLGLRSAEAPAGVEDNGRDATVAAVSGAAPMPADEEELASFVRERAEEGADAEAERGARAYMAEFAEGEHREEMVFILGRVIFAQGRHQEAIGVLQEILKSSTGGSREADTLLLLGKSFRSMARCQEADLFFDELIRKHARSEAAREARNVKQDRTVCQ